jgi:hypothetical protein
LKLFIIQKKLLSQWRHGPLAVPAPARRQPGSGPESRLGVTGERPESPLYTKKGQSLLDHNQNIAFSPEFLDGCILLRDYGIHGSALLVGKGR